MCLLVQNLFLASQARSCVFHNSRPQIKSPSCLPFSLSESMLVSLMTHTQEVGDCVGTALITALHVL